MAIVVICRPKALASSMAFVGDNAVPSRSLGALGVMGLAVMTILGPRHMNELWECRGEQLITPLASEIPHHCSSAQFVIAICAMAQPPAMA